MRDRSQTIYAEDETEYIKIMTSIDDKRKKKKKMTNAYNEDLDVSEFESFTNYKISLIEPTLIEKEKLDETLLIKSIEELNKNYKSYITKENFPLKKERENILNIQGGEINDKLKTKRSHSVFCGSYDNDFNFLSLHEKESTCATNYLANNLSPCLNNSNSTGANTFLFHNEELPISSVDTFISQNVISFDAIVKLIVIGDKAVGKSLFTERCLSSDIVLDGIYNPTESLEIKKTIVPLNQTQIKMELWDTNVSILNSTLIETYYKICHGFILICDYDRMESFNFCESQLEKIISLSKFYNNILFIVNKRQVNVRRNFNIKKHLDIKVELIHSKIKSLQNKFSISPLYLDCSYFNRKDKEFLNFLQQVMKTKTGDVYNLNKAPHISTNQRKDNEPCLKINLESPFHFKLDPVSSLKGNEPALSLNKKRTHSVKKNLSEVFKRLNFTEEKIC